ncbi:Dabb family protein [Rhodococcus tibetensis]|uniref:Dabb family protein n=1 Tax=Rhodococcus tibetensis TaxID=2965064 RepID=UPI0027E34BE7|nr:Dabb family protein [Rhodococcus sp. FXJ9.536]
MPKHISSIAAWQLSRVKCGSGSQRWTHVFEQEFTDHGAVLGQYLNHPIHWSVVDRWLDPECSDIIVRDRVCHTNRRYQVEFYRPDRADRSCYFGRYDMVTVSAMQNRLTGG